MTKIYYGIAGYHRPECKTYQTLVKLGIPKDQIVISLNDENDFEEYNKRYGKETTVIYKKGNNVACNRNNILNWFPTGTYVMVLDDDISSFKGWKQEGESKYGKLVNLDRESLENVLLQSFEETLKVKSNMFGTYAIANTMMIKSTIETQGIYSINKMFQGGSCGFIIDKEHRYNENMLLLDDYEIVLKNIKEGNIVLRRNDIVAITPKMGSSKGGYFDIYKLGKQKEYILKLKQMYPNMITIKKDYSGIILKKGL